MGGWIIFGFILICVLVVVLFIRFSAWESEEASTSVTPAARRSTSAVTPAPRRTTHASRPTDYEALSSLPTIYYVLAIFCGVVLLIVTLVNAGDLSGAEIGGLIGYTVGAVLSMFAVGRVIELLQQIRDAVRNSPALSPGRPDDE
jgi:hypothetical protein